MHLTTYRISHASSLGKLGERDQEGLSPQPPFLPLSQTKHFYIHYYMTVAYEENFEHDEVTYT